MNTEEQHLPEGVWGLMTSIDLHDCHPDLIRSKEDIERYVVELTDAIAVRRFGECTIVHFGEKEEIAGYSMTQLIETSLVSGHFVNANNSAYIDVFSCAFYDTEFVHTFTKEFFEAKTSTVTILERK